MIDRPMICFLAGRSTHPRAGPRLSAVLVVLALLLSAAPALAQGQRGDGDEPALAVHAFTLEHQSARDAVELVVPLLSPTGTIELRPGGNTLVIRDAPGSLGRIVETLREFDHPAQLLEVRIWLVRAESVGVSPVVPSDVPDEVLRALEDQLSYETYRTVGSSSARGWERDRIVFELEGYVVSFRLGTVIGGQRVRLERFEIARSEEETEGDAGRAGSGEVRTLLRSTLNPWLERPSVLVLSAGGPRPQALVVVLKCSLAGGESPGAERTRERR